MDSVYIHINTLNQELGVSASKSAITGLSNWAIPNNYLLIRSGPSQ